MPNKTAAELVTHFVQTEQRLDQCTDSEHYKQLQRDRTKILKNMHDWYNETNINKEQHRR